MPTRIIFTFVRHGETRENREGLLCGHLDAPLNALGRRQAAAVGVALQKVPFVYAFASDLSRAVDTANAILAYHQTIPLVVEPRIREKSFGEAEGAPFSTKNRPGSETPTELRKRTLGWWKETVAILINENPTDEEQTIHVLVVSHGGFIRALIQNLIDDTEFNFVTTLNGGKLTGMSNTGVNIVEARGVYDARLISYNNHAHLAGVQVDEEGMNGIDESTGEK
ncbi:hypothetical protein M408DRAFT_325963 [Serendipita vermifera MAFF 305830]|uniref:Phosphoglycerate mutase-like protein n=1 Tax=Serendipita vermifera MAFF 305830 TaxID=933852 RepID=A0A0C3BM76_SERVB|nr:hypothetical protein M408DRAFT_325963 [Serendipita vermifera MAFF 305830]